MSLDPTKLKVPDLRNELKSRGIDVAGLKKADLVAKLQEAIEGGVAPAAKEEQPTQTRTSTRTKSAPKRLDAEPLPKKGKRKRDESDDEDDESEEDRKPSKRAAKPKAKKAVKKSKKEDDDDEEEEEEEEESKPKAKAKRGRKPAAKKDKEEDDEADEGAEEKVEKPKRGKASAKKSEDEEGEEEEGDDKAEEKETKTKPKRGGKPASKKAAGKEAEEDDAEMGEAEGEDKEEEEDEEEEEPPKKAAKTSAKKGGDGPKKRVNIKVDKSCPVASSTQVYEDYDAMLNQTNIAHNNNKFYIVQLLEGNGSFYVWTHWGRVGEDGQTKIDRFGDVAKAITAFKKKFKDKTKNDWDNRDDFHAVKGKYSLVEIDHSAGDEEPAPTQQKQPVGKTEPCSLDKKTQDLIKLIFDHDMFNNSMKELEIDVEKMPLGKLTQGQVDKGHEALHELALELEKAKPSGSKISELSSRFYSLIPHAFGRRVPPPINTTELLQRKVDLLNTLADIEHAQSLLKKGDAETAGSKTRPHPLDLNYSLLHNELSVVEKSSETYKIIEQYMKATCGNYFSANILDIWELNREGEYERMSEHSDIGNRRLLWHGTSVAVIVAILSSGLRIMPHSGGRVGRGIYHASEQSKSASYTGRVNDGVGFMFLNEVALGKQFKITNDDPSLRKAPAGYDSVLAVGEREPDPSKDIEIDGEWGKITVPQGKPIAQAEGKGSSFDQSEYLVYRESQVRMKYLLKIKF